MAKKTNKPLPSNSDTNQELVLMRMSIQAMKNRICQDLDAMAARLDRLLPPEDHMRYQRFKNFTPDDWGKFLGL